MTFELVDDVALADVACEIEAASVEQVFVDAAEAFLAIQLENPNDVGRLVHRAIKLKADERDLLLYTFLQELIYLKDTEQLLFHVKALAFSEVGEEFQIQAALEGESIDATRHRQTVDAKATSFFRLKLLEKSGKFCATFVLDI